MDFKPSGLNPFGPGLGRLTIKGKAVALNDPKIDGFDDVWALGDTGLIHFGSVQRVVKSAAPPHFLSFSLRTRGLASRNRMAQCK